VSSGRVTSAARAMGVAGVANRRAVRRPERCASRRHACGCAIPTEPGRCDTDTTTVARVVNRVVDDDDDDGGGGIRATFAIRAGDGDTIDGIANECQIYLTKVVCATYSRLMLRTM